MTTGEIVKILAARLHISQKSAKTRLREKLELLKKLLLNNQSIDIAEFGRIEIQKSKQRKRYIPSKATTCIVPDRRKAVFSMSQYLREWIQWSNERRRP